MTSADALLALDDLIQSHSILRHPFYVAWQRGELTREQLAAYARVYYPHVVAFPSYLRAAIARAHNPSVREELARNLADELGEPKAHAELWLDFAEALGVDRHALAAFPHHERSAASVEIFGRLASGETVGALAALYAYESQQPEVSAEKIDGLRRHYDVDSPQALGYFTVHASIDTEHRRAERDAIAQCLADGASTETMIEAATAALDAYATLLDGVCDAAGLSRAPM